MTVQVLLDVRAPPKPPEGVPCNGCGVCCAAETCPLGLLLFRRRRGPCPAHEWNEEQRRYLCGVLARPERYLRWLPLSWRPPLAKRWIASGTGCDSSAEPDLAP